MGNENIEFVSSGLKCDNEKCDWIDKTIPIEDWKNWINAKCPKCSENLLTLDDYNNAMLVIESANLINSFSLDELAAVSQNISVEDLKKSPFVKDAKGLENLNSGNDGKVLMSVSTHKEIKLEELKKVDA